MTRATLRVAVTRDEGPDGDLSHALRAHGLTPLACPAVLEGGSPDPGRLAEAARGLERYDWLVVASRRAVRAVVEARGGMPLPARLRTAAVGERTASLLVEHGASHPLTAPEAGARPLIEALRRVGPWSGRRCLIPRALDGGTELATALRALGAEVDEVAAYRTEERPAAEIAAAWERARPEAAVVASPSAARALVAALGPEALRRLDAVVAIGPTTQAALASLGVAALVARRSDFDSVAALLRPPQVGGRRGSALAYPIHRGRRLRRTPGLRAIAQETRIAPDQLVAPLFVVEGERQRQPISSLAGHARLSAEWAAEEAASLHALGIGSVLLFGIPSHKDAEGTGGYDEDGVVPRAIRAIKRRAPGMVVWADVCLCEYTDHGHCGLLADGEVDNDATLPLLARAAVAYARAGADLVAPSDMMDGRVAAIRAALDREDCAHVGIVSYAVKYASAFYGPFREAAGSTPKSGDRRGYQMDPANRREAITEALADVEEGADALIVKPGLPCLDVIRAVRERVNLPVAAYQVSGEYSMMHAAAERGWLDLERAMWESTLGLRRAGADLVISYFARVLAERMAEARAVAELRA